MDYSKITLATAIAFGCTMVGAQEIATWSGDRKGAASFTFDDGAPSHVTDAGPLFEKYGYRATFNLVVNWNPDWNGFQGLANKGHEIASHSNSHGNNMSGEESSSKSSISGKIKQKYGCITVAYPNCNVPNKQAVNANYIVGRICNGSYEVVGKDGPSDWAEVPALMTGSTGLQGTSGFTGKMQNAVSQGGWISFLTHGFTTGNNGNANYSPTNISDIEGALKWGNEHDGDIWVAPMGFVAMYIKERKASKVNKKSGDASSITFEVTHSIKDNISNYDYPLTIKIKNDNNWTKVKATQGGADIEAKIANGNILVEAVPNAGDVVVSNGDASTTNPPPASSSSVSAPASSSSAKVAASSSSVGAKSSSSRTQNPLGDNTWFNRSSSSQQVIANAGSSSSAGGTAAISTQPDASFIYAFVDNNGYITIGNAQNMPITVFNSLGHAVRTTRGLGCEQRVYTGAKGMYIVRVGNKTIKLNIK